jgi:hypothetical protein
MEFVLGALCGEAVKFLTKRTGARYRRAEGACPGVFLQDFPFQVDFQKVSDGYEPRQDVGHFLADVSLFPAVGAREFPHLFEKPEESLIGSPLGVAVEVDLPDQVLKLPDLQVVPLIREKE